MSDDIPTLVTAFRDFIGGSDAKASLAQLNTFLQERLTASNLDASNGIGTILYSGVIDNAPAYQIAQDLAKRGGIRIIDDTEVGKFLSYIVHPDNKFLLDFELTKDISDDLFNAASKALVEQTKGAVFTISPFSISGRTYADVEIVALLDRIINDDPGSASKITSVNGIPASELKSYLSRINDPDSQKYYLKAILDAEFSKNYVSENWLLYMDGAGEKAALNIDSSFLARMGISVQLDPVSGDFADPPVAANNVRTFFPNDGSTATLHDVQARGLLVQDVLLQAEDPNQTLAIIGNDLTKESDAFRDLRTQLSDMIQDTDGVGFGIAVTVKSVASEFFERNADGIHTLQKFYYSYIDTVRSIVEHLSETAQQNFERIADFFLQFWDDETKSLNIPDVDAATALKIGAVLGTAALALTETVVQHKRHGGYTPEFWDWVKQAAVDAAIAVPIGVAAVYGAALVPFGYTVLIGLTAGATYLAVRNLAEDIIEVYADEPNSFFYKSAVAVRSFMQDLEEDISPVVVAAEVVLERLIEGYTALFENSLPDIQFVGGEAAAIVYEEGQWLVGDDASLLIGSDDDNVLIHRGYGSVIGLNGDDIIVAWNPDFFEKGEKIGDAPAEGEEDTRETATEDLFLDIDAGEGNDIIVSYGGEGVHIDGGAGDDLVIANTSFAEIRLGDGNDTVIHAGPGSVIHTGPGGETDQDTIWFSGGTLVTDADGWDRVRVLAGLWELGNAYTIGPSESEWAYAVGGLFKIGFNVDGEMVIGYSWDNDPTRYMYLSNGNRDPLALGEDLTAGIRVANIVIQAFNVMRVPEGAWDNHNIWEYTSIVLKEFHAEHRVAGADPLVLDLDGDGLELTAITAVGPSFDVDGDQFAERTGWVAPDDGFLALDRNGNGSIDDVSELFGGNGVSGFGELATLDSNGDGVIDVNDTQFADLRIWQDLDQDGVSDAGELMSLADAGIESIDLAATDDGTENALNIVARTGTFQRTDGSSGTVGDVEFRINNFNTTFTGDTTVDPAIVGDRPNLKGYGTLTDLHVALTLEGANGQLSTAIDTHLPSLNIINLETLRGNSLPILTAWSKAPPASAIVSSNPDVPLLVERDGADLTVLDFGVEVSAGVWELASGNDVLDANGAVIIQPTYADIMAQATGSPDQTWEVITGEELDYLERYYGESIPIEDTRSLNNAAIGALSDLLAKSVHLMQLQAVRLAMQGPLEPYFDGVEYDPVYDRFYATTDRQLVPTLEAIFNAAPADAAGATGWLEDWQPVLYAMLADFDRPGQNLVTDPFFFTTVVAAVENTGFILDPKAAVVALGIEADIILTGSGSITGTDASELIYVSTGDGTITGGLGADVYVIGRNFGNDVIDEQEPWLSHSYDVIRFAHHNSGDLTFYRDGFDLRMVDNATGETLVVLDQFHDLTPDLNGNHVGVERGIKEIIFANGEVWMPVNIARAVSHPLDSNDILVGTDHTDFLDGGLGNDTLTGGSGSDIYAFGLGYGLDTIHDDTGNILLPTLDFVFFGEGITEDDLVFSRTGNSPDLVIGIDGTSDQLTILGQYHATYTGVYGVQWLTTVETFEFADGTSMDWKSVAGRVVSQAATDGDDTIYGFALEDTLRGGAGDDYLSGGDENDRYIYSLGDGNDTIEDNQNNVLSGGTDRMVVNNIALDEVTFRRADNLSDLEIVMPDGAVVTISGQFDVVPALVWTAYFDRIEYFDFHAGDGTVTTINADEIMDRLLEAAQTDGDDTVHGFFRDETIEGGLGDDLLRGYEGADTYVYNIGDGHDIIQDSPTNVLEEDGDVLLFGAGISPDDVIVNHPADSLDDLVLTFSGFEGSVTLSGQVFYTTINYRPNEIESVEFADGTVWQQQDLIDRALLDMSTDSDDTITGFFTDDTLDGGAGNDILAGEDGSDTYIFGVGYGHDTIRETLRYVTLDEFDVVQFVGSVTTADITISRGSGADDIVITLKQSGETLTIEGQGGDGTLGPWWDIEEFRFTDGTVWNDVQAFNAILEAESTDGEDTLVGFRTDDTMEGGAGNDSLSGGDGDDTYVFSRGDGQDVIEDNGWRTTDKVVIHGYEPGEVTLGRPSFSTLVLTFDGTADQITIVDTLNGDEFDQIEEIVFDNGTIWTIDDVRTALIDVNQTDGDDTIEGFSTDDVLTGGLGNDALSGKDGSDAYVFNAGDGQDTIDDDGWDNTDQLVIHGYTPGETQLARNGADVTLSFAGGADQVTIVNGLNEDRFDQIEQIIFDDGTIWLGQDLRDMAFAQEATDGDDTITGFNGTSDTLAGGAGNDTLVGLDKSDTYVFNAGDGQDTIDDGGWDDTDQLVIHGYTPGETRFARSGDDLTVWFVGSTDRVYIVNGLNGDRFDQVEQFVFDDGTVLTIGDVAAIIAAEQPTDTDPDIVGTDGVDNLTGTSGDDVFDAGLGDDSIYSTYGSDVFLYASGDGNDVIDEQNGDTVFIDILKLIDLNAVDIELRHSGYDLFVKDLTTGHEIEIDEQFYNSAWYGVEKIEFQDGSYWNRDQIQTNAWFRGDDGDNTLTGTGADDTLAGYLGNDTMHGGHGSDVYVFSAGDGQDVIEDNGSGEADTLTIHGYAPADIGYAASGDALVITFTGSSDQITVVNTLDGDASDMLERVVFDDGTVHTLHDIRIAVAAGQSTDGNDILSGLSIGDYLVGGLGNDILHGLDGSDIYVFYAGDGQDTIEDNGRDDVDQLYIYGYAPADTLFASTVSDSLDITFVGSSDQITLFNTLDWDRGDQIEQIVFEDGTVLNMNDVRDLLVANQSTDGDDTITGLIGDETLEGGLGNDILHGLDGSDTYVFNAGDGQDIVDDNGGHDTDKIVIHGRALADTTFASAANDSLVITFAGSSDQITVVNTLDWNANDQIEQIVFDDGTVLTMDDVRAVLVANQQTDGDDTITAFIGNDTIEGGLGSDTLYGLDGSDTYVFNVGDGQDTIDDNGGHDTDQLVIHGHALADTMFASGSNDSLIITFAGSTDQVTLVNTLDWNTADQIEQIVFDDGTLLSMDDVRVTLVANQQTDSDDTITAFIGNDTLEGGRGNDTLYGLDGSDTYVFNVGDGQDTIDDNGGHDTDQLVIHGHALADTIFASGSNDSLVITFAGSSDQVTLVNTLDGNTADQIEQIVFDDGTVLTMADVAAIITANQQGGNNADVVGTSGDDTLSGTDGDNVFDAGLGDDSIDSRVGSDTFLYASGDGNDFINEENGSTNYVDILKLVDLGAADVELRRSGVDLFVKDLTTGHEIEIDEQFYSADWWGIEKIEFQDGSFWDRAQILANAWIRGDNANNSLSGTNGDDVFVAGLGDDNIDSRVGSDTFLYSSGDGNDYINEENGSTNYIDILRLTDLNAADIELRRSGVDLFLKDLTTGHEIEIDEQFYSADWWGIEKIEFQDGSFWDRDQILANAWIRGDDGDNGLAGSDFDDIFDAGLGDDNIYSTNGSDTFMYASGDGSDFIDEQNGSTNYIDILKLTDLNAADIELRHSGNDLIVKDLNTGHEIEIDEQFYNSSWYGIERIEFQDGSFWDRDTIQANAWFRGDDGDNAMTGTSADDTFVPGLGDDSVYSTYGSDTFIYASGDGNDVIDEQNGSTSYIDILRLTDLNAADIELRRGGNDLFLKDLTTGHEIEIDEQFYNSAWYGIERIEFQDGSFWDRDTIQANAWFRGDDGDNAMTGTSADDTFYAGLGNDSIYSTYGSDTFVYASGDGNDVIDEQNGSDSYIDVLRLTDLNATDIELRYSGNDAVLKVLATGHEIEIDEQFYNSAWYGVERIEFQDGSFWDRDAIRDNAWFRGDAGDNTLSGTSVDDTLAGGLGDDTLSGLAGNDTFVYGPAFGNDTITDFTAGAATVDAIVFNAVTGLASYSDVLANATDDGTDTTITLDVDNTVVLQNVLVSELSSDDFLFW